MTLVHFLQPDFACSMTFDEQKRCMDLLTEVHRYGICENYFYTTRRSTNQLVGLSEGGLRIRDVPNAGGSSINSEILSYEIRRLLFGAKLSRTEMELEYFPAGGSISDYSIDVDGKKYGVSVARAMKYKSVFTIDDALRLLTKKLTGIRSSTRTALKERWDKQILHIWVEKEYMKDIIKMAYATLDEEIKGNTCVLMSIVIGNCDLIFRNT